MKKLLLTILAISVAVNVALAGDNAKPITKAGNAALMFNLGGLANLSVGNYEGGLGFKYYIANDFAVRLGLGFSMTSSTDKNPTTTPLPATVLSESKLSSTTFTVAPGIQYNIAKSNAVVAYVGGQVSIATTSQERDGNSVGFGVGFTNGAKYKESGTIFGVAAFVGAEWFPWDNISFAGEYRIGFVSGSGKIESTVPAPGTSTSVDKPSSTVIGISSANAASLTLSVFI